MISTIASSYEASADLRCAEPHTAWLCAWQRLRDDGQTGRYVTLMELPTYLADVPGEDQKACACDLITEHMRLYSWAGEPQLEDYIAALGRTFPWLLDAASLPADLIEDEFLIRSTPPDGDYPRLANYLSRFPNRPDVLERLKRRCLADQRYIKLRVIGIGALGVVYEAYDSLADELVALKEAPLTDPEATQRLTTEMQLAAELNHPGIVQVQNSGCSDLVFYYVMDLITGRSLGERTGEYHDGRSSRSTSENRQQLRNLIECVIQMCDAAAHAHDRGILHRDLKPGNVIVRDTGEAVIIDWGLARRMAPLAGTKPGPGQLDDGATIVGTPQYMPPEQVDRQETELSDIFSLGATLYEVLTGHPPYDWPGHSLPSDWQSIVRQGQIAPPRRLASGTPRQLDAICMKALAKSPHDRYASATELAADLRQFLDSTTSSRGWFTRIFSSHDSA